MSNLQPEFAVGARSNGFCITAVTALPELRAIVYQCEHEKSGARLLHMHSEDSENCFAVTFPTPPSDDTGLPHIMEHSVLGGSRKYPVREPFFEMVKMSVATFINAMTAQAYTVYPIATTVKNDFFNLVDVYLDAVFYPQISEDIFRREAHHYSLVDNADLDSPLTLSGIVYNEMKGAYSSPESLMWEHGSRGLFPETPLGRDSGGDPKQIPQLSYEKFCAFHREYYHPSNGLFFIYGNIPTAEHLAYLAPTLAKFDRRAVVLPTPRQPRWTQPRLRDELYPIGADDSTQAATFLTLNWLVGDAMDPVETVVWALLSRLLLGDDAAPLKKALIDSHLGQDMFFSGECSHAYELCFHVGLRGSEPERVEAFEQLVMQTLQQASATGFTPARIDAAFQRLAYDNLEVSGDFPLKMLEQVNESWPYGGDPQAFLRMQAHLQACRQRYDANPQLFSELITTKLLHNPHRLRVCLRPDQALEQQQEQNFAAQMQAVRERMSAESIAAVARQAEQLKLDQLKANSEADLASLPQLTVHDLPPQPQHIPTERGEVGAITLLHNRVFANGVNYLEISIDLTGLPLHLYSVLPRFTDAVMKMGAAGLNYSGVAERRSAVTGGMNCYVNVARHVSEAGRTLRTLNVGLKTLDANAEAALQLLEDLLFQLEPGDKPRLHDVLTQARSSYRSVLVNDGAGTARRRAARGLSCEAALAHQLCSRETLEAVEAYLQSYDEQAALLVRDLEQIRDFLHNRKRWVVSFTGSDAVFAHLQQRLQVWSQQMHTAPITDIALPLPTVASRREGLMAPLQIAHCVQAMPAPLLAHPDMPLINLGIYLLRFDYLLPEIRFKGNAYGASMSYDSGQGLFVLSSFRDPHIVQTLQVFAGVRAYIEGTNWNQTDVNRAIIGSAKRWLSPIRPSEATIAALTRYIRGETPEFLNDLYARGLAATAGEVHRALLEHLDVAMQSSAICVVANRDKLAQANKQLGDANLSLSELLPS